MRVLVIGALHSTPPLFASRLPFRTGGSLGFTC